MNVEQSGPNSFSVITRYAITHRRVTEAGPKRVLTFRGSARNAFDIRDQAEEILEAFRPHLSRVLDVDEHASLRVDPVVCWRSDKAPVGYVFDIKDEA